MTMRTMRDSCRQPHGVRIALAWLWCVGIWVLGSVFFAPAAHAQAPFALTVTLHDAAGAGVAGVTILVTGPEGAELATATTDATGRAALAGLPAAVRVRVVGQPRGGPALYQVGADATGVRLDLAGGATHLALRVERDGMVLPDPQAMAEAGGMPIPAPADPGDLAPAPLATVGSAPPVGGAAPPAPADGPFHHAAPEVVPGPPAWVLVLGMVALVLGITALLLLHLERGGRP